MFEEFIWFASWPLFLYIAYKLTTVIGAKHEDV